MGEIAVSKSGSKAGTGPVEVARLHKPEEKRFLADALAKEEEKGRQAGAPIAPEVRLAKAVAGMDRETLQRASRENSLQAGSLLNHFEKNNNNPQASTSDLSLIGVELRMTFGGPKGTKNQFNAEVTGIVGGGLSTVVGAAGFITAGSKTGEILEKINPDKNLNKAIAKVTGMEHNPNLDTRSVREISVSQALIRYANADKWSEAARKEGFKGFDQKADPQVNAVNYALSLLQPSFDEFKRNHPKISQEDMKKIRANALETIMFDKPYADSGITGGFKKLFRHYVAPGVLENGKLSADTKNDIKDNMKTLYSDLRESAK